MEYIEYPKSLYRNGEELVVQDRAEDDAALAQGWTDWNTDHNRSIETAEDESIDSDKPKRKYTRRNQAE